MKDHCTAIVLSAGQGKRMGVSVAKQYIMLEGKPIIYYSLKAFQDCDVIDDIVMVVGAGQEEFVKTEIVDAYELTKVSAVVAGGAERYESVANGVKAVSELGIQQKNEKGYIFVHDGARPFVDDEIIKNGFREIQNYPACVVGMPSKDTVRIVDEDCKTKDTPDRRNVWIVQTPQIFERELITEAFRRLKDHKNLAITDDGMVVETMMNVKVKMIQGSYENIKVTTAEDLDIAKQFIHRRNSESI